MDHTNRVVVLVDMDCFYCQVEENLDPNLAGKPLAVVQYNQWRGGGIIAVNYPARDKGVTRHMRGSDAKAKCPELILVSTPTQRGKADLTKYREAGKRVAEVLQTFTNLLERASVDEAYLDITEAVVKRIEMQYVPQIEHLANTHIVGCNKEDFVENAKRNFLSEGDLKLCIGGVITEEIRAAVLEKTGYKCSAGVAHNKILAKLSCGLHKPNQQTVLPHGGVEELYEHLPVRKIKSLGGKFGEILGEELGIGTMAELRNFSEHDLVQRYDEKTGSWLYNIARGIDNDPVTIRLVSKSIGCCKKFPGRTALTKFEDVTHWINELSEELSERLQSDLQENNRKAKQMVVSFSREVNRKDVPSSRTHPLNSYEAEKIASDMLGVINKYCMNEEGTYRIKYMGISAGKFEENKKTYDLTNFFSRSNEKTQDVSSASKKVKDKSILNFFNKESKVEDPIINENYYEYFEVNSNDADYLNGTICEEVDMNDVKFNQNCTSPDEDFKNYISSTKDNVSDDSITEEIIISKTPKKESYFTNYFENIPTPSTSKDRNFDTSRNLEESVISSPEKPNEDNNEIETNPESDIQSAVLKNTFFENSDSSEKQICHECDKQIPIPEMPSHLDYHFALKIVREEAHLYSKEKKPTTNNSASGSLKTRAKADTKKKNKRKPEVHCNKLALFLSNEEKKIEGPTEVCPECSKKIPISTFSDHMDYHAAKKLHAELNSVPVQVKSKVSNSKNGSLKGNGIASYFKKSV